MHQDTGPYEPNIHIRAAAQILAMAARRVIATRVEVSFSEDSQGQFDAGAQKLSPSREDPELALPVGPRRGLMSDDPMGACCPKKETPQP
jgi:hypothetical protein